MTWATRDTDVAAFLMASGHGTPMPSIDGDTVWFTFNSPSKQMRAMKAVYHSGGMVEAKAMALARKHLLDTVWWIRGDKT